MWLNQLKIAIIEKNTDKLSELMNNLPKLEKQEEIAQAIYLIKEATFLVQELKDSTAASMTQMKKNIVFLNSTQAPRANKFDIKS
jgi:hypothetical protein